MVAIASTTAASKKIVALPPKIGGTLGFDGERVYLTVERSYYDGYVTLDPKGGAQ